MPPENDYLQAHTGWPWHKLSKLIAYFCLNREYVKPSMVFM